MNIRVCIFCFNRPPPGLECTYGLRHEYPPEPASTTVKTAKVDRRVCTKCGLHQNNPASASADCAHEYP